MVCTGSAAPTELVLSWERLEAEVSIILSILPLELVLSAVELLATKVIPPLLTRASSNDIYYSQ
jgi:hypothetical protein